MAKTVEKKRTSYFNDEELELMKGEFLDFSDLAALSIKLFQRSWWRAFLAPILWSILVFAGFIIASFVGGLIFGFVVTFVSLSKQPALLGVVWLILFAAILAWVFGYIYLIVQLYIRNLVLLGDSSATFWKPNTKIWTVFSRLIGIGFILAPISLLISTITLTIMSGSSSESIINTVINSSTISLFSTWISVFLFPFTGLIVFKSFNVKQALLSGWQMNKNRVSDLVYRNFFIALVLILPLAMQSYISYNYIIAQASNPELLGEFLISYLVLIILGVISSTIFKYLSFTSYTNILLLNKTKEAKEFELTDDQNSKMNNTVTIALVLGIVMIVVYFWSYFGFVSKINPGISSQQMNSSDFMESK